MKNKFIAATLVLGFTIAPTTAFAAITTNQGGTPSYSCPQGTIKDGANCITPETTQEQRIVDSPAVSYTPTTATVKVKTSLYQEGTTGYEKCYTPEQYWHHPYQSWVWAENLIPECATVDGQNGYRIWNAELQTQLTCPDGGTLQPNETCLIAEVAHTELVTIPQSSSPATVDGVNGGSLVASVTGLLSPVWNFIQTKLLPAIALLVILGISVRLSLQAVRKFSKVA